MGSKGLLLLALVVSVGLLLYSMEVSARNLAETSTNKEINAKSLDSTSTNNGPTMGMPWSADPGSLIPKVEIPGSWLPWGQSPPGKGVSVGWGNSGGHP